ncbi:hypothetical protein SprV_0200576100 [Sparganum proliferum]
MVNFYRRFLPNCADLMLPLTNMLSGPKSPLELTGEALTKLERIKNSLAGTTLLTHLAGKTGKSTGGGYEDGEESSSFALRNQTDRTESISSKLQATAHGSHSNLQDCEKPHVHLDVVGPLPPSNGFTHLLICVDRCTRWAEAIPLPNARAETIVKAFVSRWVAMFGAPSTVTTDRGAQYESALFQTLLSFIGCTRIRTTAYYPAGNGMVERFHRQLKTALRAVEDPGNWSESFLVHSSASARL